MSKTDDTRPNINTGRKLSLVPPLPNAWAALRAAGKTEPSPEFAFEPRLNAFGETVVETIILTNEGLREYLADSNGQLMALLPPGRRRRLLRLIKG